MLVSVLVCLVGKCLVVYWKFISRCLLVILKFIVSGMLMFIIIWLRMLLCFIFVVGVVLFWWKLMKLNRLFRCNLWLCL